MLNGFIGKRIDHGRISFFPSVETAGKARALILTVVDDPVHQAAGGLQIFLASVPAVILQKGHGNIRCISDIAAYLVAVFIPLAFLCLVPAGQPCPALPSGKSADIAGRVAVPDTSGPGISLLTAVQCPVMIDGVDKSVQDRLCLVGHILGNKSHGRQGIVIGESYIFDIDVVGIVGTQQDLAGPGAFKITGKADLVQIEYIVGIAVHDIIQYIAEAAYDIAEVFPFQRNDIFLPFVRQSDFAQRLLDGTVRILYGLFIGGPVVAKAGCKEFHRFTALISPGIETEGVRPSQVQSLSADAAVIQRRYRFTCRQIAVEEEPASPVSRFGNLLASDTAASLPGILLPVLIHVHNKAAVESGHFCFLSKVIFRQTEILIDIDRLTGHLQTV